MPSRPQFSLRMLLLITAAVALAAATAAPLRPPPAPAPVPGQGWGWHDLGFAIHAQAALRLVACLLFPSLFAAGAIATHGNLKTFCLGAVLPAAFPLVLIWHDAAIPRMFDLIAATNVGGAFEVLQTAAWGREEWITTLWAIAPGVGLSGVSLCWLLRHGENGENPNGIWRTAHWLVLVSVLAGLSAAMLLLPPSTFRVTYFVLLMIRTALCVLVPALLAVGVAESRGYARSFFAGGALPALLPLFVLVPRSHVYDWRGYIAMAWALIPLFGATCLFFHWMFQHATSGCSTAANQSRTGT